MYCKDEQFFNKSFIYPNQLVKCTFVQLNVFFSLPEGDKWHGADVQPNLEGKKYALFAPMVVKGLAIFPLHFGMTDKV